MDIFIEETLLLKYKYKTLQSAITSNVTMRYNILLLLWEKIKEEKNRCLSLKLMPKNLNIFKDLQGKKTRPQNGSQKLTFILTG